MKQTTLIVPGYQESGPQHWQSWIEQQEPQAVRVSEIDWDKPLLAHWSAVIRAAIDAAAHPVWLVAHSFGALASVVAAADRPHKVAGALLVAPADPQRFTALGLRQEQDRAPGLDDFLPQRHIGIPSIVVASTNDPWVRLSSAAYWAERWGSRFISIGAAGHINVESGHGPWPQGLALLREMQQGQTSFLLGPLDMPARRTRRDSSLAKIRHLTRLKYDF